MKINQPALNLVQCDTGPRSLSLYTRMYKSHISRVITGAQLAYDATTIKRWLCVCGGGGGARGGGHTVLECVCMGVQKSEWKGTFSEWVELLRSLNKGTYLNWKKCEKYIYVTKILHKMVSEKDISHNLHSKPGMIFQVSDRLK